MLVNIIKLVIDKNLSDEKIEKLKVSLSKLKPFQLSLEYNVVSKTIGDVEYVDAINIREMFDEFYEQMELEDDQGERVKKINDELCHLAAKRWEIFRGGVHEARS